MDRATREMPADAARMTAEAKATYLDAIRDWVRLGQASDHALDPERARARAPQPTEDVARAHVFFKLAQHLIRHGQPEEADRWLAEASRLHPDSWAIWRQRAGVNELGLAALPDFWARVDALGERRYYAPVDMKGMP
jgi:Flp pilus assembly protein TadD